MSISQENKIKILEYKLSFEQLQKIEEEFKEGNSDLNYRLSFFRDKISTEKDKKGNSHQSVFDSIFMTHLNKESDSNSIEVSEIKQSGFKAHINVETWLKKTYRKIAKLVHPDMLIGIKSKIIKNKFLKLYDIAKNAYENNISSDIIMIAYELDIEVDNEIIKREVLTSLSIKNKKINETKKKIGWQWYHVPDANKDAELKKILSSMGFIFSDEEVENVIKSRKPSRKVGQRPVKINVKRKKLK